MKKFEIEEIKKMLGIEFSFLYDFLNPIVRNLELNKDATILDVGTGQGRMAIILALNNYKVLTGEPEMDNSEYAKQDWVEKAKLVNVDHLITFKSFSAEKMPFEDKSFDAIFILGTFHHINDRIAAFKEVNRVIRPSGRICIIEPTQRGIKAIRKRFPNHPDAVDPRDYTEGYSLNVEIKRGSLFDAFIFNVNK